MGGDGKRQAHCIRCCSVSEEYRESVPLPRRRRFVELPSDFRCAHSQDGAAHEHIFAASELRVETCADLEKAADSAMNLRPAFRGARNPGKDFQQRGLAGAVAADETKDFAFADVEGDVFQGPDKG